MDRSEKPRRGGEDDNGGTLFRGLDPRYFEMRSQNNGIHRWILNPSRTLDVWGCFHPASSETKSEEEVGEKRRLLPVKRYPGGVFEPENHVDGVVGGRRSNVAGQFHVLPLAGPHQSERRCKSESRRPLKRGARKSKRNS